MIKDYDVFHIITNPETGYAKILSHSQGDFDEMMKYRRGWIIRTFPIEYYDCTKTAEELLSYALGVGLINWAEI